MPFAAGVTVGLLFFKPQLGLVVAIVLVATCGWRALAGVVTTSVVLLAVTLLTLPGTLGDYLVKLPPILHTLQFDPAYNWGRQDTLQSFWRLLCEGHVGGPTQLLPKILTWIGVATIATLLAINTRRVIRESDNPGHDVRLRRLIAATILSMPLLMPYYMDYDLLLLAVPVVLFARDWLDRQAPYDLARLRASKNRLAAAPRAAMHPQERVLARVHLMAPPLDRWQIALWICLFFETQINPGLAGQTRLNLAVPLLAALCAISLFRCRAASRSKTAPFLDEPISSSAVAA